MREQGAAGDVTGAEPPSTRPRAAQVPEETAECRCQSTTVVGLVVAEPVEVPAPSVDNVRRPSITLELQVLQNESMAQGLLRTSVALCLA